MIKRRQREKAENTWKILLKNCIYLLYNIVLSIVKLKYKEVTKLHLLHILEKFKKRKQRKVLTKATECIMCNLRTIKTIKDYKIQ